MGSGEPEIEKRSNGGGCRGAACCAPTEKNCPMELIDSHAHIDFPQFAEDRDAMLERARASGVTALLAIGTGPGPEKLDSALPFAEQHDWIYATVCIHPPEPNTLTPQPLHTLS